MFDDLRAKDTKPPRLPNPPKMAACYSLDLYCDHMEVRQYDYWHKHAEFPWNFTGETFGQCASQAREKGWTFHRDGTATCPKCNK